MTESSARLSLPHGWQVKASKKYPDRVYYFNVMTGSSTWECPELDSAKEELKVIEKKISPKVDSQLLQLKKDLANSKNIFKRVVSDEIKNSKNLSSGPSDGSSKSSVVPTAVVVPVIHKKVKFNISAKAKLLPSKGFEVRAGSAQKKRKVNNLDVKNAIVKNTCPLTKKKKNKGRRKNKKNPPLNISDDQKNTSKDEVQKFEKPTKKFQRLLTNLNEVEMPENSSSELVPSENNDVEDIEMLDISIIEDLTNKKETVFDTVASYYIVVDTNVLISELNLVNELKETPMNGCGPPHIFIPWVVIEELDGLKNNRNNKNLLRSVCEAIRFLNSVLSKHPRFHGQSPMEAKEWAQPFSKCNDDKILECCVGLGDKMPKEKVILLTNDRNLVNKALILGLNVHNFSSMMKSIKPDVTFNLSENDGNKSRKRKKKSEGSNVTTNQVTTVSQDKQKITQELSLCKREMHTIMCTARQLLKNNLSKFLDIEMNEAYGSTWLSFPIQRNLLDGVLAAILKYWRMVFSLFMTEKDKRNVVLLHEKVSRPSGFLADDKEECLVILSSIEDIFHSIKRRSHKIKAPVERIQEFRVAIVNSFNSYDEIDSTIKQAEQESALAMFERNWTFINHLCGIVLDTCCVQHDFQYDRPSQMLTDVEVRQLMVDFHPGLQQLKTQMFAMHTAVQECKPTKNIFKKLSRSLLNFIPSMRLPYESFTCPHFSPRALEMFCTNPQNRKMIEIGCKQIEKFFTKLDEALVALLLPKTRKICTSPETMICD